MQIRPLERTEAYNGYLYANHHHHHHHHISVMELGQLLTRSGLTYPEVSSKVCHDYFYQLGNSVSLHYSPINLHINNNINIFFYKYKIYKEYKIYRYEKYTLVLFLILVLLIKFFINAQIWTVLKSLPEVGNMKSLGLFFTVRIYLNILNNKLTVTGSKYLWPRVV
jgi:hypothetical protein